VAGKTSQLPTSLEMVEILFSSAIDSSGIGASNGSGVITTTASPPVCNSCQFQKQSRYNPKLTSIACMRASSAASNSTVFRVASCLCSFGCHLFFPTLFPRCLVFIWTSSELQPQVDPSLPPRLFASFGPRCPNRSRFPLEWRRVLEPRLRCWV